MKTGSHPTPALAQEKLYTQEASLIPLIPSSPMDFVGSSAKIYYTCPILAISIATLLTVTMSKARTVC